MAEPTPPLVRSEFALIEDLFRAVEAGRLRIPTFLSSFRWTPADMLALFDSINKRYPIGPLLIWDARAPVPSADHIGPLQIPEPGAAPVTYLIDGCQRFTTLYGALCIKTDFPRDADPEHWRWWIYYDLRQRIFLHLPEGVPGPHLMPLRAVLRTVDFLEEVRRMKATLPGNEADALRQVAERLARRVKSYKLAVTRIDGGSVEQADDIRIRLTTPRGST